MLSYVKPLRSLVEHKDKYGVSVKQHILEGICQPFVSVRGVV